MPRKYFQHCRQSGHQTVPQHGPALSTTNSWYPCIATLICAIKRADFRVHSTPNISRTRFHSSLSITAASSMFSVLRKSAFRRLVSPLALPPSILAYYRTRKPPALSDWWHLLIFFKSYSVIAVLFVWLPHYFVWNPLWKSFTDFIIIFNLISLV